MSYDKLRQDFPVLYSTVWGFECGPGWEPLLRRLSERLEPLAAAMPEHDYFGRPHAEQVKEKFGTLRFYISHATPEMHDLIQEAEDESCTTCEGCGAPGVLRGRGWLTTACDACWSKP